MRRADRKSAVVATHQPDTGRFLGCVSRLFERGTLTDGVANTTARPLLLTHAARAHATRGMGMPCRL